MKYIMKFKDPEARQLRFVGGKNASLANMIQDLADKVRIPDGFAMSVDAYWYFLSFNNLVDKITDLCQHITVQDEGSLQRHAAHIRTLMLGGQWPQDLKDQIVNAYQALSNEYQHKDLPVAVRSSATAEDLPTASFAGQQESYLYVTGEVALLDAVKNCMASLFTDRALFYRMQHKIDHMKVGISVGVQKMVNVGSCAAGVAFSLDPQTGFKDAIVIDGSYGFGELVVKGRVTPDEFVVFKPTFVKGFKPIVKKELGNKQVKLVYNQSKHALQEVAATAHEQQSFCLSESDILQLAEYVVRIETYYQTKSGTWSPQDIEWAQDELDGHIYIVQARPETVYSTQQGALQLITYTLQAKNPHVITKGLSVGQQIISGKARVILSIAQAAQIKEGDIIVTQMTDPDWVPSMKKAAAIITERGGRTCHAAIVSRELGIPALVATGNATTVIADGTDITLDCSQGDVGYVYQGLLPFEQKNVTFEQIKPLPVTLLVNIASPHRAFALSTLPVQGVGLARIEFILTNQIGIHPMAIIYPDKLDEATRKAIAHKSSAYASPQDFFIQTLAQGIGMIAAAFWPREVDVRFSDLKSNEYRNLIGGTFFEPSEQNPMLGLRGASRYYHPEYQQAFALECQAVLKVRSQMGLDNVRVMFPFVRTVDEAQKITTLIQKYGLERGKNGLKTIMVLEIPADALLIDQFAPFFDGFSIGSNDLTQLTLGVDRDSEHLALLFDEQNQAVKKLIEQAITGAHAAHCFISICGQAPSDYPEFAQWLLTLGIDAISLNVDAVIPFLMRYQKSGS